MHITHKRSSYTPVNCFPFTNFAKFLSSFYRAAIQAISSYLEAFQKIADAATNSKGRFFLCVLTPRYEH